MLCTIVWQCLVDLFFASTVQIHYIAYTLSSFLDTLYCMHSVVVGGGDARFF